MPFRHSLGETWESLTLFAGRFSWAAFGGRFLVPSSPVLTSLRGLNGVCPVARKLATAQRSRIGHQCLLENLIIALGVFP